MVIDIAFYSYDPSLKLSEIEIILLKLTEPKVYH